MSHVFDQRGSVASPGGPNPNAEAQLGQTNDPRDLVPGDPEGVHATADAFATQSQEFEQIGNSLGGVDIPDWQGAASDSFWETYSHEKSRWLTTSDAFEAASKALRNFAEVLTRGQQQARDAIDLWNQGEALSNEVDAPPRQTDGPDPASDPGEQSRSEARTLLQEARSHVMEAGDHAADTLRGQTGDDGGSGWLSGLTDAFGGVLDSVTNAADGDAGELSQTFDPLHGSQDLGTLLNPRGWEASLGSVEGGASVWGTSVSGEGEFGGVDVEGEAGVDVLGADYEAEATISADEIRASAGAEAYVARAHAEGSAEYGLASAEASGQASAGAEANTEASLGRDGLNVGGEAFVGASAEGEVSADVGGVGAGMEAEAYAGVGVEGNIDIGRQDDGSYEVSVNAGAALGIGGGLETSITVDPGEVTETLGDARDALDDAAGTVTDVGGDAVDTVTDVVPNPF